MAKSSNRPNKPSDISEESTDIFAADINEVSDSININPEENEMTENINEDNSADVSEDVNPETSEANSEENASEVTEEKDTRNPYIPIEEIPQFPELSPTSAPLANALLTQIITFRNSAIDVTESLDAAAFDNSEENVLTFADKYGDRDALIPDLANEYSSLKNRLAEVFNQLTEAVKRAANVKVLSAEEKTAYENELNKLIGQINNGIDSMKDFETRNPFGSIQPAIDWVDNLPALPVKTSTKTKAKTVIGQGVSRPRLGNGGYIQINGGSRHESFSKAMPDIVKAVGHDVKAPEVHRAWFNAAGITSADWSSITPDKEITFQFDGAEIKIMRKAS